MPLASLEALLTDTVLGSGRASRLILVALIAKGHVLIEGAPGVGKTSLAQTVANHLGLKFRRVQFTPDLLPSDLLGYNLYHQNEGRFEFIEGPAFCNLLLADEINRTSPRVQSALLEAMNEGQVSLDGVTRQLPSPHLVIATQNDVFATGTFPLPEPQLDRFLLSIHMELPDLETQKQVLLKQGKGQRKVTNSTESLDLKALEDLQTRCQELPFEESMASYIINLCEALRLCSGESHSVSVRASLSVLAAARAHALLEGHPAVHPEDVRAVIGPVMRHRLAPGDSAQAEEWIDQALEATPVP